MKEFTIDARVLKSAKLFAAKNDVRSYLNGVHIIPDGVIAATDGAAMFYCDSTVGYIDGEHSFPEERTVVNFKGTVPAKATQARFIFIDQMKDIGGDDGIIQFLDARGKGVGVVSFWCVDVGDQTKYDRWDVIISDAKKMVKENAASSGSISFNPKYIGLSGRACKALGSKISGVRLYHSDPSKSFVVKPDNPHKFDAIIVIMPLRID